MLKQAPLILGCLAVAAPAGAQQKVALTKPDAEFAEPYTSLRGIREFADGRVLVSDVGEKVVQLVDFRSGTALKIGREGQGPEEYLLPMSIFPTGDGGALLQDMGNRRFLPINAQGKIGTAITLPTPSATTSGGEGRQRMMMMGGGLLLAGGADAKGNIYFQGSGVTLDDGESIDSVPLMRWATGTDKVDTVAWLPLTEGMRPRVQRDGGRGTMMVRIGGGTAWPKQVGWAVAPDGRIAFVTPEPYQVIWVAGGRRTAGPAVPYTPIKVTEADKKQFRQQQSRARPVVATFGGGARVPPPNVQANGQDIEFPDTKPPFSGNSAVLLTPEGEIWVQRLRPAGESAPLYDVFDPAGRKMAEVTLRPDSRIIGFGKAAVYVVRSDEDDLQYLERYQRPAMK